MMKVYVLTSVLDFEDRTVRGVFSTLERAEQAAAEIGAPHPSKDGLLPGEYTEIEEHEVDAGQGARLVSSLYQ